MDNTNPQQPKTVQVPVNKETLMQLGAQTLANSGNNIFVLAVRLAEIFKEEFPDKHKQILQAIAKEKDNKNLSVVE